jgi:hypothetical protein
MFKKIILSFLALLVFLPNFFGVFAGSNIPRFDSNFANKLKKGDERVYDPSALGVDSTKSLRENIAAMFYPTGGIEWGRIFDIIRVLAAGFFVGMIMFTGIQFVRFADDPKKIESARNSLIYVWYGGFLIFWSAYLVWLMEFNNSDGSAWLVTNLQNNILVNIITFIKGIVFFFAIIMIFWYAYQIIQAMDAEDKRKKGINGVINVMVALIIIKLLDYVYYIAQQQDFKNRAVDLLVDVSKVVGYILGALMLFFLLYAGFLMVASNGEDTGYKRAVSTLKTIFMVTIVIFLFLMIIYQFVNDFS